MHPALVHSLQDIACQLEVLSRYAAVQGFHLGWFFAIMGGHAVALVLLLRLSAAFGKSKAWELRCSDPLRLFGCSLGVQLPVRNDCMLLVMCMAVFPGCYVSDVTASKDAAHTALYHVDRLPV